MPSLAYSTLRPAFARSIGFYEEFATTDDITTSKVVVSTELPSLGYTKDGELAVKNGFRVWVYIKGTNNDRLDRIVDTYTGSTGSILVRAGASLAAESGAQNCELLPFSGADLKRILNLATFKAFPQWDKDLGWGRGLYLPVQDDTIFTGFDQKVFTLPSSIFQGPPDEVGLAKLIDAGNYSENYITADAARFDSVSDWSGTQMTTVATIPATTAPRTFVVLRGENAGRFKTNGGSTEATVLFTVTSNSLSLRGVELNLSIWVYCVTSGRLKARIDNDGSTTDSTNFHNGRGLEKLSVAATILDKPTTLQVGIVDPTNTTGLTYFPANAILTVGPGEIAEEEYEKISGWTYQPARSTNTDGYLVLPKDLKPQRALRIRGRYYISSVDTEASTMEINEDQAQLLYAHGREILFDEELKKRPDDLTLQLRLERAKKDVAELTLTKGKMEMRPPVLLGLNSW